MKQISGGTRQSDSEGALRIAAGNCDGEAGLSLYIGLSPAEQDPGEQNAGEDTWEVCRKAFQVEGTS